MFGSFSNSPIMQGVTTLCWAMATSLETFGSALDCATYLGDHRPNDETLEGKFAVGELLYIISFDEGFIHDEN